MIRTNPKPRARRGRSKKIYDVRRFLSGGNTIRYSKDGRPVVESLPKQLYVPAINPSGHLLNVTVHTDVNNRDYHSNEAKFYLEEHIRNGFIFAHQCPLGNDEAINPEDAKRLFGADAKPCTDHDFGWKMGAPYAQPNLCPHLEEIQRLRRAEAEEEEMRLAMATMSDAAKQAKLNQEQTQELIDLIKSSNSSKRGGKGRQSASDDG